MKYIRLITLSLLIASCSSTKQTVETPPKKTPEITKTKDSIDISTNKEPLINPEVEVSEDNTLIKKAPNKKLNHSTWTNLLQKHVSKQGNVNYEGFKNDKQNLQNYITSLRENSPTNSWRKEEKLSYWINAYNAFTIDLILRHYPLKSIKDIKNPWDLRYWKIDNKWYNLNEIEHDILRKMKEPRIHFAIVCASFSCPKLQNTAFNAFELEDQLTNATKEFLNNSKRNNITVNSIELSKIFQWFAKDFKQNGSLVDFLNTYSDVTISAKAKKSFKNYNWDLND